MSKKLKMDIEFVGKCRLVVEPEDTGHIDPHVGQMRECYIECDDIILNGRSARETGDWVDHRGSPMKPDDLVRLPFWFGEFSGLDCGPREES